MGDPRRIGLLGAECTGKSTLALALADALDGEAVPEQLRQFVAEHGRPPRADEQVALLEAQMRAEDAAAAHTDRPVVIGDPAPLMTAVYHQAYFDDDSLIDSGVAHARGYDLLVCCDTDLPWVDDPGMRDGQDWRDRVHALLLGPVAARLSAAGITPLLVHGDVTSRVGQITEAWRAGAGARPT